MKVKDYLESTAGAITILLFCLIFYSLLVIWVAYTFSTNKEIYLLFAGLLGNFSGSLFTIMRGQNRSGPSVDASGKSVEVNVTNPLPPKPEGEK